MSRPRPAPPRPAAPAPGTPGALPPAQARRLVALLEGVREAHAAKRHAETIAPLREAVALAPAHHDIRLMLANAHLQASQLREALQEFNEITRRFPARSDAWNNLAGVLTALGHFPQAAQAVARSLACDPTNAQAMLNLAEISKSLGDWGGAREAYEAATALSPDDIKLRMQHGYTLVTCGDWPRGWALAEARDRVPGMKVHAEAIDSPRWDGTAPLAGRTILVTHEQGFGDMLMGIRFARDLAARGARVLLRAPRPLVPLLSHAPGVHGCTELHTPLPAHDCHVPVLSLPAALGLTLDALDGRPYLAPPGDCPPAIAAALPRDGVPTVGLAWAGNPLHINDRRRSIAGELLAPLLAIPGVRFVSLQKLPALVDCLPAELRPGVLDAGALSNDFAESAHLVTRCDLVLSVDSAVAHLAGALGVPTLTCLPYVPDYRWLLDRADTPWYASMALLRQRAPFDWGPVLADAEAAVRELAAAGAARAVA
jgi:hypothetical protein